MDLWDWTLRQSPSVLGGKGQGLKAVTGTQERNSDLPPHYSPFPSPGPHPNCDPASNHCLHPDERVPVAITDETGEDVSPWQEDRSWQGSLGHQGSPPRLT